MRCAQSKHLNPILDGACTANVTLHLLLAVGQLAAVFMLLHLVTIPQNHYINLRVLALLPNTCSLVQWMRSMHLEVSPGKFSTRAHKAQLAPTQKLKKPEAMEILCFSLRDAFIQSRMLMVAPA